MALVATPDADATAVTKAAWKTGDVAWSTVTPAVITWVTYGGVIVEVIMGVH